MVDIHIRILKPGINQCAPILTNCIFPDELKLAIIPIHKKDNTIDKENYRPISLLQQYQKFLKELLKNS